jgi:tRNA(Ile)-lysidine synthase
MERGIEPGMELAARVRTFARERCPSLAGRPGVLLAVSGGADSSAMASLLLEAQIVDRSRSVVAHFDHGWRGAAAAERDAAVVRALCDRYSIPLVCGAWRAPVRREAAARAARYEFLARVANERGIDVVATGHTLDDQVETVIMNTMRGVGTYGLAGMAPDARWPLGGADARRVVRPLLGITRDETRAYCEEHGIAFVDDPSNEARVHLRNRVRHELLPEIDIGTPEARQIIARLADQTRDGIERLEAATAHALIDHGNDGDGVRLSRAALREMTPALAPYALRQALRRLLGDERDYGRRHFDVMSAAADARTGSTLHLPRGVVLTVDPHELLLTVGTPVTHAVPDGDHPLPFEGTLGGWRLRVTPSAPGDPAAMPMPADAVVRRRRPGDRIQPRGMSGHKKLQDYYTDRRVPRRERDAAPVIAHGADVLWTPFGVAEPMVDEGATPFTVAAERA